MRKLTATQQQLFDYITTGGIIYYDRLNSVHRKNENEKAINDRTLTAVHNTLSENGYIREVGGSTGYLTESITYSKKADTNNPAITKEQLFQTCAPMFNFELNAEQLLEKAIERNILTEVDGVYYIIDKDYHNWIV